LILENHQVLVKYLLGDLPDPERERFERDYFANDEAWESLTSAENDLIDSYIRGRLSQHEQRQFERCFLQSQRRRERFEFAQLLMDPTLRKGPDEAIPQSAQQKSGKPWSSLRKLASPFLVHVPAAAALLALVIAAILAFQNHRLNFQLEQMKSQQAALQTEIHTVRKIPATSQAPHNGETEDALAIGPTPTISMLLEPGNLRSAGAGNTHQIPEISVASGFVVLALDLARDEYPEYSVELQTAYGRALCMLNELQSRPIGNGGRAVIFKLPSELLSKGDYIVWLSGQAAGRQPQRIDSYLFSIVDQL